LLFVLLSVGLITFNTINDPQMAFHQAVSWVSGNALGIVIVLFMHGVLWPHTGEKAFEGQLKSFFEGLAHLFTLKMAALPHAWGVDPQNPASPAEIRQLEGRLIGGLMQIRLALGIASRDTDRFARFEARYADLVERLQSLMSEIMAYGENMRIWRDTPLAGTLLAGSATPREIIHVLSGQLHDLITACERPRDGTEPPRHRNAPHAIEARLDELRKDLDSHEHSVLEAALFDAVTEKAVQTSQTLAAVREALATVEQPGRPVAAPPRSQVDLITRIRSPALRLQKAAIGTIAAIVASLLWIYLDWPDPGSLMVYLLIPVAFNAMVPTFPIRAALRSLFWGPAIAAVLYFGIMPGLDGMWQLAPVLILFFLPSTYLTNSANPATMMSGLFTSLWIVELIDLSEGQVYSFSNFSDNLIGIWGGVGVALATLAFFAPPVPERQFKTYARAFLRDCERAIGDLRQRAPLMTGERGSIAARRGEWLEFLCLCELWARQLDHHRHPEAERAAVGALIEAMWAIAFRLEALEEARQRHPDETLIAAPSERCSQAAIAGLTQLGQALASSQPVPALAELSAAPDDFRAVLEPMHAEAHRSGEIRGSLHGALTLTGFYCALAEAIEQCRQRTNDIDWQQWDLAYF
jgi:Fusaric acid resistance protein family